MKAEIINGGPVGR